MSAPGPLAPDRVGRDGALRLRFERRGAATVATGWRYTLPLQAPAPVALDDPAGGVSILNPTGGLVGGDRLLWEDKDVFTVPTWTMHEHVNTASRPAFLFSFTDAPVMKALDLYREDAKR